MTTATRQKAVYAALVVAVIWGGYNLLGTKPKPPLGPVEVEIPVTVPTAPTAVHIDQQELQRIAAADWSNDPFRTPIKVTPKQADKPKKDLKWVLSGIVYNDRAPMAVINKKTVRAGDVVDNARVVTINQKSVLLECNGNRFTLKVTKS